MLLRLLEGQMLETSTELRLAGPEDAASIARLVDECYEGTHPVRECVDPAILAQGIESGAVRYLLAHDESGRHVGQVALDRRGNAGLYEYSRGVVDRSYRGRGLFSELTRRLITV